MAPGEQCPLCLSPDGRVVCSGRLTLLRCPRCGAVHNASHRALPYDSAYFNEEYRAQYGKTYVEDFDNIYRLSRGRLELILNLLKRSGSAPDSLLDLGSAYGFFLKAAADAGFRDVTGLEISDHAAGYCRDTFQIPVITSGFDDADLVPGFRVITAWYFLEHVPDTRSALERITSLLEPDGIFAFSMPSLFGPQFLLHREEWCAAHPEDHRVDISPRIIKKALKELGYRRVVTRPGGIHPRRFFPPLLAGLGAARSLYSGISKIVSFSDTMEVYAVKDKKF